MIERPILFSAPMVRAILDGRKSQTRRVVKPSMRNCDEFIVMECFQDSDALWPLNSWDESEIGPDGCEHPIPCPYGETGDRLWVRETYAMPSVPVPCIRCGVIHPATHLDGCPYVTFPAIYRADFDGVIANNFAPWKPSIFMPRWASRITLEITGVRVERVQDISESDAQREGWDLSGVDLYKSYDPTVDDAARVWYSKLWDSINGKSYPWVSNPWVWVIEFKREVAA